MNLEDTVLASMCTLEPVALIFTQALMKSVNSHVMHMYNVMQSHAHAY